MSGTIIAGVLIGLVFLVSFSEWFYHLITGMNVLIEKDIYLYYRMGVWAAGSLLIMGMTFWILSLVNECPSPREKEGVFRYLDCDVYWGVRAKIEGGSPSTLREKVFEEFYEAAE